MKNQKGTLISRLIAAIPAAMFHKTKEISEKGKQTERRITYKMKREENLNKIFMVRYRIQHL